MNKDVLSGVAVGLSAGLSIGFLLSKINWSSLERSAYATALTTATSQIDAAKADLIKELHISLPQGVHDYDALPQTHLSHSAVQAELALLAAKDDALWKDQRVSGCVYWGDEAHASLLSYAQSLFLWSNPLHPDVFPAVTKMERDICRMTMNMLGGSSDLAGGAVTSGGTESILMAVKGYRDEARARGMTGTLEVIVCVTAHAAFDKAAQYFGVKLVKVPCAHDGRFAMDIDATRRAITRQTILLVGSAPQYPHGTVDPIDDLSALALEYDIGLHVDACLGGFLLPFLRDAAHVNFGTGFDFAVPGVTSMSCDTHKYGYTSKGTSVVLFRHARHRHGMYFVCTDWPGGTYASPTIAGSRPGALSAACWASLIALGRDRLGELACGIHDTFVAICEAIQAGECGGSLRQLGDSRAMVVAVDATDINIQQWASCMSDRGWNLNRLQLPNAVHLCVTAALIGCQDAFIKDSKESHDAILADPTLHAGGAAKIYGMTASMPGTLKDILVTDIAMAYLDVKHT